jgi:hypothetical protein
MPRKSTPVPEKKASAADVLLFYVLICKKQKSAWNRFGPMRFLSFY